MKDVNNLLLETLQRLINTATNVSNFMVEQLPDVLYQLLLWKMVESLIVCLIGIVLITITGIFIYKGIKNEYKDVVIFSVGGPIAILFMVGGFMCLNLQWLQIWLAPKIYLIEYGARLLK